MSEVLIALGSSIEPREEYVQSAIENLSKDVGPVIEVSSPYANPPLGPNAQNEFLNLACIVKTTLSPQAVLKALQKIEANLGRTRDQHWADRTIDLDIILWKTESGTFHIESSPSLTIPHPEAHKRDFVLIPCREIASNWLGELPPPSTE